jgi:DNA-binding transcriptional MocR family regulator
LRPGKISAQGVLTSEMNAVIIVCMLPADLAEVAHATSAKAVYIVPTIQNPSTITLSAGRRQALADVARDVGLQIIEDDAYGMLVSAPEKALSAIAPDISYHVATLSKVLSPALRVAYVAAPNGSAMAELEAALRANTLMASPLLTGLATAWINDGTALRLRDAIRVECRTRQAIAREILPHGSFAAHPEGIQIWLATPPGVERAQFLARTGRQGLALVASEAFWVGEGAAPDAGRVSLGAPLSQAHLRLAMQRLASVMGDVAVSSDYVV